jgi:hypothetical protein
VVQSALQGSAMYSSVFRMRTKRRPGADLTPAPVTRTGDPARYCLQFVPEQLQMLAPHVHEPDVWQVMSLQEHVLDPVHVRLHALFGFWQLAWQFCEPLHV